MKKTVFKLCMGLLLLGATCVQAKADEGMWLVNLLKENLARQMKRAGCRLQPGEIYNEEQGGLSDAVVSLDFGCTGSMVSHDGLLITNHHCAYVDVYALSSPEHNYLEEGFFAMTRGEEIPIPGKNAWFLRRAYDVTQEVNALKDSLIAAGRLRSTMNNRMVFSMMERRYHELSGLETQCVSLWGGTQYYMFCYQVYSDVRLVAAPPVSIAAFGGETDNWEWPQHKGDFALYRVYAGPDGGPAAYAADNVPLTPRKVLKVSTRGMKQGSFAMVMGYPGRTFRYNSSFGVEHLQKTEYPVFVAMQRKHLDIMKKWMDSDPALRLKYANSYFGISNVQELREGEIKSFGRACLGDLKRCEERKLADWIAGSPSCRDKWGDLLTRMDTAFAAVREPEDHLAWLRSTLVTSAFLTQGRRAFALNSNRMRRNMPDSISMDTPEFHAFFKNLLAGYEAYDIRVEREWFFVALHDFYRHVPRTLWGEYLARVYDENGQDAVAAATAIFDHSFFRDEESFRAFFAKPRALAEVFEDPCYLTSQSAKVIAFNNAITEACGTHSIDSLRREYTRSLYRMREACGCPQYPDANATMRLSYGKVCDLKPMDGLHALWYTTVQGLWDKHNSLDYEFQIKPRMQDLLKEGHWGRWAHKDGTMHVNFLTDLDITGGNSGSPVLNARGELIGLAFDGNKESLAGDAYYHPELNRCVCVDIRYCLWILEYYAGAGHLVREMTFR